MSAWFIAHTTFAVAAVIITGISRCRTNMAFALALLSAWAITALLPHLEAATDLLDALIGAAAVMLWFVRRDKLWDWKVALAIVCLFAQGFHAAYRGGLYEGDDGLRSYQVRLNVLFDLAVLCTVTGPIKRAVTWFGDRFLPVPADHHGVGAGRVSEKGSIPWV